MTSCVPPRLESAQSSRVTSWIGNQAAHQRFEWQALRAAPLRHSSCCTMLLPPPLLLALDGASEADLAATSASLLPPRRALFADSLATCKRPSRVPLCSGKPLYLASSPRRRPLSQSHILHPLRRAGLSRLARRPAGSARQTFSWQLEWRRQSSSSWRLLLLLDKAQRSMLDARCSMLARVPLDVAPGTRAPMNVCVSSWWCVTRSLDSFAAPTLAVSSVITALNLQVACKRLSSAQLSQALSLGS